MGYRYDWQEQLGASGLQEVLALAAALKDSGLFTEAELAALRAELKALVLLQARGLISTLTAAQAQPAPPAGPKEQLERVRQQLHKVGAALK